MNVTTMIEFDAAHRLLDYPGKCQFLHGHRYKIEATVSGKVPWGPEAMLVDFGDLKAALRDEVEMWDHVTVLYRRDPLVPLLVAAGQRVIQMDTNPTAEAMAELFFSQLLARMQDGCTFDGMKLASVRVWETPTSFAEKRGDE